MRLVIASRVTDVNALLRIFLGLIIASKTADWLQG